MDLFSVVQFFKDGSYEYVRKHVPVNEAADATRHYTTSVGARMGFTTRVIITDMMDQIVFEWNEGRVIYPTQEMMDEVSNSIEKYEASEENRAESIADVKRNKEKS